MDNMTIQTLQLSEDETALLGQVLREHQGTLRQQVYHAETAGFKDELKAEQRVLAGLLAKLPS
jgi:hypothetical protein